MSYKIGLVGLAGAGKDEAAKIIKELLPHYEIDRYAAILKEAARQVFGENFDDRDVKEESVFMTPQLYDKLWDAVDYTALKVTDDNPTIYDVFMDYADKAFSNLTWVSPRLFQQLLGTEVGRNVHPNIWVNYLRNQERNLIIPDVRFDNELVDFNILITRHPVPKGKLHASEVFAAELQMSNEAHLYVDEVVYNDGSLEDLRIKLEFNLKFHGLLPTLI